MAFWLPYHPTGHAPRACPRPAGFAPALASIPHFVRRHNRIALHFLWRDASSASPSPRRIQSRALLQLAGLPAPCRGNCPSLLQRLRSRARPQPARSTSAAPFHSGALARCSCRLPLALVLSGLSGRVRAQSGTTQFPRAALFVSRATLEMIERLADSRLVGALRQRTLQWLLRPLTDR